MSAGDPFAGRVRVRVSALIVEKNQIALVQQKTPTRPHPVWLPPGGGVQPGESSGQALRREIKEETGLLIQDSELRYVHEFIEPPYHAVEFYFRVKDFAGELKTGNDPELDEDQQQIIRCRWVSLNDIEQMDLYPRFLKKELRSGGYLENGIHHYKS